MLLLLQIIFYGMFLISVIYLLAYLLFLSLIALQKYLAKEKAFNQAFREEEIKFKKQQAQFNQQKANFEK